jgi:small subunit ribosomal protein S13
MEVALTYIHGIGKAASRKILLESGVLFDTKTDNLSDDEVVRVRKLIDQDLKVEGDLKRDTTANVRRHMEMGSYRGLRHRKGLPVRGQRTHTNGRTRRGPRKTVAGRKIAPSKG